MCGNQRLVIHSQTCKFLSAKYIAWNGMGSTGDQPTTDTGMWTHPTNITPHETERSTMANGNVPSKLVARSPNPPWSRDAWDIGWQQVSSDASALPFKLLSSSGSRNSQIYQQFERQGRRASEWISRCILENKISGQGMWRLAVYWILWSVEYFKSVHGKWLFVHG